MVLPEQVYWAAFCSLFNPGYKTVSQIINEFGSMENVWKASDEEIRGKIFPGIAEQIIVSRSKVNVEEHYNTLLEEKINVLTIMDSGYPQNLKFISSPPPILYVKGELPSTSLLHIAVVGTRRASVYAMQVAEKLSFQLASSNAVVVSGMARGVDSYAHKGAIEARGKTIAVLGCGLDVVYPRENKKLMDQIWESGAVISEFPLGTQPNRINFPIRNRIISGLSSGLLVVEAPERSGALITVDFALEQGKDVFAVPGLITNKNSRGSNRLIKEGAKLVETVDDILEEYPSFNLAHSESSIKSTEGILDKNMKEIIDLLRGGPVFPDELCQLAGVNPAQLNVLLTQMELKGLITISDGKVHTIF